MNRHAFSTLAAALLTAVVCVRSASAQDIFQRCNSSSADAESMSKQISDCRTWSLNQHAAQSAARAETAAAKSAAPVEVMVSTILVPGEMVKAVSSEPQLIEKLSTYFAYEGFVAGDPGRCSALTHVIGRAQECHDLYDELTFTRALAGPRPDFMRICLQHVDMTQRDIRREQLPDWCAAIADSHNNPSALCAKLIPMLSGFRNPHEAAPSMAECRAAYGSLSGDASGCIAFPADRRPNCQGDAQFAKASKARNIVLCGTSARCRVLMGDGKRVLRELSSELRSPAAQWMLNSGWITKIKVPGPDKPLPPGGPAVAGVAAPTPFKGFVCADPIWSEGNRKAADATIKAAQQCLTDIDSVATPSLSLAQGIDSRLEKLARLRLQINGVFESGAPVPRGPARAPANARTRAPAR